MMVRYDVFVGDGLEFWEKLCDLLESEEPVPASSVPAWIKVRDDLAMALKLE